MRLQAGAFSLLVSMTKILRTNQKISPAIHMYTHFISQLTHLNNKRRRNHSASLYSLSGIATALAFLLTAIPGSLTAETVIDLAPMVIVAPNVPTVETAIPGNTIRSAKPIDLASILAAEMPAAALSRKSPLAGDLVLRGMSRDNVLITVDDASSFCACPNRMDPPAFHVSSQQIESVRIRTGPFTVEQGGTVGGALFVKTTSPSNEPFARAYAFMGSHDYHAAGLTLGSPLTDDNWFTVGGVYYQDGNVYQDGDGTLFTQLPGTNYLPEYVDGKSFEVISADAKVSYDLSDKGVVNINYGYQNAKNVLYPGLKMDSPSDVMNRASIGISKPLQTSWADEWSASFAYSNVEHDMVDSFRTSSQMNPMFAARGYMMRTIAESLSLGARINAKKTWENSHLRYGSDLKRRIWDADNVLGPNTNDMLPDVAVDTLGFWAVYEARLADIAWESGVRVDFSTSEARDNIDFVQEIRGTDTNKRNDVLPSAYVMGSKEFENNWSLYGGLGFATRTPDAQERYMNLDRPMMNPDWVGNPDLDPTHNTEIQFGTRWADEKSSFSASVFHAWLDDYIYLHRFTNGMRQATSYANIDARLYGFSLDASTNTTDYLRFEAGIAWQKGIKTDAPFSSNDVLAEVPPLKGRVAAIISRNDWTLNFNVQFQDDLSRVDPDLNEYLLDGWWTANLSASWQINENVSLSGGVENIMDEAYSVANAFLRDPFSSGVLVNEPGRFFYARVSMEL